MPFDEKLKTVSITIDGDLDPYITSKDLALALIGSMGTAGATGYAIEFAGTTVERMTMEARMTLCNLAIEAGARCAMVAFDDTTAAYIRGKPMAPTGQHHFACGIDSPAIGSDGLDERLTDSFVQTDDFGYSIRLMG